MEVGPEILGYGSSGTLVFEGTLDGRPIAVKRILCQVHKLLTCSKPPFCWHGWLSAACVAMWMFWS